MTYEQLTESPFCLDYGTKVEIEKKDGTRVLCHFGGYRTASAKIIDKAQLVPQFHEITNDGRMSRNLHVITFSASREAKDIQVVKNLFSQREEEEYDEP